MDPRCACRVDLHLGYPEIMLKAARQPTERHHGLDILSCHTVVLYVIVSLRVLKQYERGVVFLLGKFAGVRGRAHCDLRSHPADDRACPCAPSPCKFLRKRSLPRTCFDRYRAVAYYHITDPEKAVIAIENVYNAINQISQTTVRNVVGRFSSISCSRTREHQRPDQERHRLAHGTLGHAGNGGRNQGHHATRQHAASDGQGSRAERERRARSSREGEYQRQ